MIVWSRMGWLVPALLVLVFVGGYFAVNELYGDDFFLSDELLKLALSGVAAVVIGIVGIMLNARRQITSLDEKTGQKLRAPAHTFFFIRMEFWALIIPLLFGYMHFDNLKTTENENAYLASPESGDLYIIAFTDLGIEVEDEFEYGVLQVRSVEDIHLSFAVSNYRYSKPYGIESELKKKKVEDSVYYSDQLLSLSRTRLTELNDAKKIHTILRGIQ